jgi:hypothetical protein
MLDLLILFPNIGTFKVFKKSVSCLDVIPTYILLTLGACDRNPIESL